MRKPFVSRSPILLLILAIIGAAAILLPHDIKTTTESVECIQAPCPDIQHQIKSIGFPYVWKKETIISLGDEDTNSKETTKDSKRLGADIAAWAVLLLIIGLFPIKYESI